MMMTMTMMRVTNINAHCRYVNYVVSVSAIAHAFSLVHFLNRRVALAARSLFWFRSISDAYSYAPKTPTGTNSIAQHSNRKFEPILLFFLRPHVRAVCLCVFFLFRLINVDATTSTPNHMHNSKIKTETEERERKTPKKLIARIVIYTAVFDVTHIIIADHMHETTAFHSFSTF